MAARPILVTGFEPFGGMPTNPSLLAAGELDGKSVGGRKIFGRSLPVSMRRIREALQELLDTLNPAAVISLGLAAGEAALRLERVGVNLADFDIDDNDGLRLANASVSAGGPGARFSTLPLARIADGMLAAGIPATLSPSAGTYLCNASLYCLLELLEERGGDVPAGLIHLPCTPELAACLLRKQIGERRVPLPSMDLARMVAGVEIAIRETLRTLPPAGAAASV